MNTSASRIVSDFFDRISGDYDASIFRGCPVYEEMLVALLDHLWLDPANEYRILELGCGTGNLTCLLAQTFPNAHLTFVDIAPEMLAIARQKIASLTDRFEAVQSDFNALDLPENTFDLVISSIALHHLDDPDKARLYRNIFRWLKPGGRFRCADQCMILPAGIGAPQLRDRWLSLSREKGANEEEIALWVRHSDESDHYTPIFTHFQWLSEAGFQHIDCYWRKVYWTLYGGEKPAA